MNHNMRTKRRRKRRNIQILVRMLVVILAILIIALVVRLIGSRVGKQVLGMAHSQTKQVDAPNYDVELLTTNPYSRPGTAIDKITGIVVHYTANPGTTAKQNRNYFEGLKDSHQTSASSHFVIGMDGELIQCIPCNEISYASNNRNHDTISVECCIPDDTGKFTDKTYATLVHLVAWLCGRYGLSTDDVIRHYDVTGKLCPKYYVKHEDAWEQFKKDVDAYIVANAIKSSENTQNKD